MVKPSEALFEGFVAHDSSIAYIKDENGAYLYVSPALEKLFGVTGAELIGRTDYDHLPFDVAFRLNASDRLVLDSGQPHHAFEILPIAGVTRHWFTHRFLIPGSDDRKLMGGLAVDITESLHEDTKRHWSSTLVAAIMEGTSDAILVKDLDGRYVMVNPAGETFLGKTRSEVCGKTDHELFPPDLALQMAEGDRTVIESGVTHCYEETGSLGGMPHIFLSTKVPYRSSQGKLIGVVSICRDITKRKKAEEMLEQGAYHDMLTGLPNRAAFMESMDRSLSYTKRRASYAFAVVYVDLDDLKLVNDTHGLGVGDAVLQETALRLEQCLRVGDIAARLGGDEFAVILDDVNERTGASMVADRIQKSISVPYNLSGRSIEITASVGVVTVDAGNSESALEVLTQADKAMYRAKQLGKNRYCVYEPA